MSRRLESHRSFFHFAGILELILFAGSRAPKNRDLDDIFWHDIPSFRNQKTGTFGEFIDAIEAIAKNYSCAIHPASDEARAMPINGRLAYAMAMRLLVDALGPTRTLKREEQLIPVVRDIVSMVEAWGSFRHPAYGKKVSFNDEFVYYAKSGFVGSGANLADFNESKARAIATKAEGRLSPLFSVVPGEFGSQMLSYAVIVAGDDHGEAQAKRVLASVLEP